MNEAERRIASLSPEQRELLMRRMRERGGERAAPRTAEIPRLPEGPVDRYAPVPPTDFQEALWLSQSGIFDLGGCGANVYLEYEFPGIVWQQATRLNEALRILIERHEMLRTILLPDGQLQLLSRVPPYEIAVEDLSGRGREAVEEHLLRIREELRYAKRPLDRWPLFEVVLHQLDEGKIRLHARFDLLLVDGATRNVLLQELVQVINFPEQPLGELDVSFLDHARAMAAFRETETYARARAYWMERLPHLPHPPVLPLTRALTPGDVPRVVKREPEVLGSGDWKSLCARAARAGITPTAAVTAAFAEVLRLWSTAPDFSVGFGGSYRPPIHPHIGRTVGSFTVIHLLALEDGPGSFLARARRLQERITADLENQAFSGHQVLRQYNRLHRTGARSSMPIQFNSVVEYGRSAQPAPSTPAAPEETAPQPRLDLVEIDFMASLPMVLLFWVALENEQGGLSLVSQAVEEVLPAGLVPEMIESYRDLLSRLATQDAAWSAERPAQTGRIALRGAAQPPPVEAPSPRPAVAPRAWSRVETELAALWEEVLGRRPAALDDDFFLLGGDSVTAVRLLARISRRWGQAVDPGELFVHPDLAGMAAAVRDRQQPESAPLPKLAAFSPVRRSASHGMRIFLTLWFGQLVSAFGTGLGSFALGVWIFEKTGSATSFAMIAFAAAVTMLLLSPIAGSLADRWDRRRLLLLSDLGSGATTLVMAALLFTGRMQPWHVYPIVILMVGFTAFQGPALLSSVSLLVPRSQLARASGMTQSSRAVAQIIGPLIAGVLVGRIGYSGVILIDCGTFLFAVLTILLVRIPSPPRQEVRRSPLGDLRHGWEYLRGLPGLVALLGLYAVTNFCMSIVQVLLTPLVLSFATPEELGSVSSAGAAGVMLGGLTLSLWGGPRRKVLGIFVILVAQALLLVAGGAQASVPLITLATFAFMFTVPVATACNQAILQSRVAIDVQGRVFAVAGMITACSIPVASLIAGPLADRVFGPLLQAGGPLAHTVVGRLIGVGPGRGMGLMFICLSLLVLLTVGFAFLNPRLWQLEAEALDSPETAFPSPTEI
jgi:MFS family permease/aryl carrier-like protein